VFIPGVLLLSWLAICFPVLVGAFASATLPATITSVALLALALLLGQVVQAIGSLLERFLFWTWGGRPSDTALHQGLGRYFDQITGARIRKKLAHAVGQEASSHALFAYAVQLSEAVCIGRAARFNMIYAYHRDLLVLLAVAVLLLAGSLVWGAAASWPLPMTSTVTVAMLLGVVLFWHRAKQRSLYYAREVLYTAERVLDDASVSVPEGSYTTD